MVYSTSKFTQIILLLSKVSNSENLHRYPQAMVQPQAGVSHVTSNHHPGVGIRAGVRLPKRDYTEGGKSPAWVGCTGRRQKAQVCHKSLNCCSKNVKSEVSQSPFQMAYGRLQSCMQSQYMAQKSSGN